MATALSTSDKKALKQHESTIENGLKSFVDVGNALAAIRDTELYMGEYTTFEAYCKKRWNLGKSRAYQYIESAQVTEALSTIVDVEPPQNEAQARVLADLPNESAQATVWTKAVNTAPKDKDGKPKITAAHVRATAEQIIPTMPKPPVNLDSEPEPEAIAKPAKPGKPKVDVRKFDAFEKQIGAAIRANTALKDHCGGQFYHEQIRQHFNGILKSLRDWKKDVL